MLVALGDISFRTVPKGGFESDQILGRERPLGGTVVDGVTYRLRVSGRSIRDGKQAFRQLTGRGTVGRAEGEVCCFFSFVEVGQVSGES